MDNPLLLLILIMDKPPFVKEERLSGKNHPLFLSRGKHDAM